MSKAILNLDKCHIYYNAFIRPSIMMVREKNNNKWLYVYGVSSNGIIYVYRVYDATNAGEEKDIPKDVTTYMIKTRYNTVELRVGTFYRIEEFIDELGDLTMTEDLIPIYDADGYQILHYEDPKDNLYSMYVYAKGITKDDDLAGAIISSIILWHNKINIQHDSWNALPTAWSAHGETFGGQLIDCMKFITDIHKDQNLGNHQDNMIAKLISTIITNLHGSNAGIRRYKKPKKNPIDYITSDMDNYDFDPAISF